MQKNLTEKNFLRGMTVLMAVFPSLNLEKEKLKIIFEILKPNLDDMEFEKAIGWITTNRQEFFPTSNIVVAILDADGAREKKKIKAWLEDTNRKEMK